MVEINDSHILMYLDKVADPEIKKMIESKREYQIRARELERLQRDYLENFYRATCPDSLDLGEYLLGVLPKTERKMIERHVDDCPHCASELREMEAFNRADSLIHRIIATLIGRKREEDQLGWMLEFGERGSDEGSFVYEASGAQIAIDLQDDGDHIGYYSIVGLITGMNAQDYEVSLWREGDQVGDGKVNPLGNFSIDHLESGEYEIMIRGPRVEILVQTFRI